ncbi:histidinol-phosphate transaminase [Nanchangia anserum]|uniref:Histidinol-phosphate aminotransferase n=1 Tax=Nanchangia anserum TaxID=2692125 RepID=A0A8I0GAM8_9ACTO|nr:histidinol-phosphate transaminase [Nanchangia anserum]MBD3690224.1 histidinol-phosphate transaminase [Nanchangia anserum]QOX82331.1 histidinol-phosphate transaminase [Nanchangia anserum]
MSLPLRPELAGIEPYGAPQLDVAHRLNVNENPYPPSDAMIADITEAVREAAASLNRYADRDCVGLREDLAAYLRAESRVEVEWERVWAANGSNEIMTQLLQAFGGAGRCALTAVPSYSMYPEYARDTGTDFVTVARRDDFALDIDAMIAAIERHTPAIIFLASPNNPTGTALEVEQARAIIEAAAANGPDGTSGIVIIDEAYGEFRRDGTPSALELLADYDSLVVTRTMSKAFGMAGLRLGYCVAAREIIDAVMVVRLPYHLSGLTQVAARAALRHADEQLAQVGELRDRRDRLAQWLRGQGFHCPESDANFCLFGPVADRHRLFEQLLERGVLVREVGPEGYVRVSVGTADDDRAFRVALEEVDR